MPAPDKTTEEPALSGWLSAYFEWHAKAIQVGTPEVNDAFLAGYRAAIRDMKEVTYAD